VREEIIGLKDNTRVAAMDSQSLLVARQGLPIYEDFTRIGGIKTGEESKEGGFASTGWPDECKGVSELHIEIHSVENCLRAEFFSDT
jgi:hypothetical protein